MFTACLCPSQSTQVSRDDEMHRSVLGQLKPNYAKADGSFARLRCGSLPSP